MEAARTLRLVRRRAQLTLRELARRAGTSHATLSAYENGHKVPSVETLDRVVRAAGFRLVGEIGRTVDTVDAEDRGRELAEVLDLAERFPARHDEHLAFPVFRRASTSPVLT